MKHPLTLAVTVLVFAVLVFLAIVAAVTVAEWRDWVPRPHVLSTGLASTRAQHVTRPASSDRPLHPSRGLAS